MPHLPCTVCQKVFYRCPAHLQRDGAPAPTCSHKCAGTLKTGANNPHYKAAFEQRQCLQCGTGFTRTRSEMTRGRGKYCSQECYGKSISASAGSYADRPCGYCGIAVKSLNNFHLNQPKRFCSLKCAGMVHRNSIAGENNPRYVNGESAKRYKATFRSLAKEVRIRDDNYCQLCGMTAEDNGKRLDVHHVDYDKDNNIPPNAVSLCRFCHGKMHGNKESRATWQAYWDNFLGVMYGY